MSAFCAATPLCEATRLCATTRHRPASQGGLPTLYLRPCDVDRLLRAYAPHFPKRARIQLVISAAKRGASVTSALSHVSVAAAISAGSSTTRNVVGASLFAMASIDLASPTNSTPTIETPTAVALYPGLPCAGRARLLSAPNPAALRRAAPGATTRNGRNRLSTKRPQRCYRPPSRRASPAANAAARCRKPRI